MLVAKEMPGTPIKLIWSREEDMTHCQYHPITMAKLTGGLDAQGNLVGLQIRISGQSILASLLPQNLQNGMDPVVFQGLMQPVSRQLMATELPNLLVDHAMRNPHITAGFWRGVNVNQNAVVHGMLHGRAGRRLRAGPAGLPHEVPQAPSGRRC